MLYFNPEKKDCTGCTACVTICPVQCIHMIEDEEGFVYSESTSACIHCGQCERVCPIVNRAQVGQEGKTSLEIAYCAATKDKMVWKASTSGGAFTEICKAFAQKDDVIYGAAWNGFEVQHLGVKGVDNIAPLRKSKYIESRLNSCFAQILKDIRKGRRVVFCGTPCQVAGLRQCVGENSDNLLLIDLICHGVGSPKVFRESMQILGEQFEKNVQSYEFRTKRGYHETDYLCKVNFADNSVAYVVLDPYMQLFFKQDCLRPSCGENCRFRSNLRPGDITIADFKGLEQVFPEMLGTKRNYSTIVFHTEKGLGLLPTLKKSMTLLEVPIEAVKKHNPLFYRQTVFSKQRDEFFQEFLSNPKETIKNRTNTANVVKQKPMQMIFAHLPVVFRRFVIRAIRRLKNNEK